MSVYAQVEYVVRCDCCEYMYSVESDNLYDGDRISMDEGDMVSAAGFYYTPDNGEVYCEDCFSENYSRCEDCDEDFPSDETQFVEALDRCICNSCLSEYETDENGNVVADIVVSYSSGVHTITNRASIHPQFPLATVLDITTTTPADPPPPSLRKVSGIQLSRRRYNKSNSDKNNSDNTQVVPPPF